MDADLGLVKKTTQDPSWQRQKADHSACGCVHLYIYVVIYLYSYLYFVANVLVQRMRLWIMQVHGY